jgi:hypothetical protein
MSSRKFLTSLHTILAAFFLPMGLMYAITGGLYGLDIKGGYRTAEHSLALTEPLPSDLAGLAAITQAELKSRNIDLPTGTAGVRKVGTSFAFEWSGTRRDVELAPTANPLVATLKIKDTTPHRFFVQLHKAKGATAFKWFAAVWMVGLVLLFITGGILAIAAKPFRKLAIPSAILGAIAFVVLAAIS